MCVCVLWPYLSRYCYLIILRYNETLQWLKWFNNNKKCSRLPLPNNFGYFYRIIPKIWTINAAKINLFISILPKMACLASINTNLLPWIDKQKQIKKCVSIRTQSRTSHMYIYTIMDCMRSWVCVCVCLCVINLLLC